MTSSEREAKLLGWHAARVALRDRAEALAPVAVDAFDAGGDATPTLDRIQAMDRERARVEEQIDRLDPGFRSRGWWS